MLANEVSSISLQGLPLFRSVTWPSPLRLYTFRAAADLGKICCRIRFFVLGSFNQINSPGLIRYRTKECFRGVMASAK